MTPLRERDYLVETAYACAWVRVKNGVIVYAAPIYRRRWLGRPFDELRRTAAVVKEITDKEG